VQKFLILIELLLFSPFVFGVPEVGASPACRELFRSDIAVVEFSRRSDFEILQSRLGSLFECGVNCLFYADANMSQKVLSELRDEKRILKRYADSVASPDEFYVLFSQLGGFSIPAFDGLIYDRKTLKLKARFQIKSVKPGNLGSNLSEAVKKISHWNRSPSFVSESEAGNEKAEGRMTDHDFGHVSGYFSGRANYNVGEAGGIKPVHDVLSVFQLSDQSIRNRIIVEMKSKKPIGEIYGAATQKRVDDAAQSIESITVMTELELRTFY
jgi:hypothetical protein